MQYFPDSIKKLIAHFDALPGIGPKHAIRLVLHLLSGKDSALAFAHDLDTAVAAVRLCAQCQTITDHALCSICSDPRRDKATICVVAHVQDIEPIERTGKFNGTYHILHGMLNPIEGITPDQTKLPQLFDRVKKNGIGEVIVALDATSEGEATGLYVMQKLQGAGIRVTKLARGLPVGSSIEYADEVTLSSAFENRR